MKNIIFLVLLLTTFNCIADNFAIFPQKKILEISKKRNDKEISKIISWAIKDLNKKPKALERVHTEGLLPNEDIFNESKESIKDLQIMFRLAVVYHLTGEKKYLDHCLIFYEAWINKYKVSFNPIDETKFDQLIFTYDLIQLEIKAELKEKSLSLFREIANGYIERIEEQEKKDITNWQSHRIKLITLCSFVLNDSKLLEKVYKIYIDHINLNIYSDGSVYDFYARDALHYVVYNLEPLIIAAISAKQHGHDWVTNYPIERAIEWLIPYSLNLKFHEEFKNTKSEFDIARRNHAVEGYSGEWKSAKSYWLFCSASLLNENYKKIANRILEINHKKNSEQCFYIRLAK